MSDEIIEELNDIEEDHREEGESIQDLQEGDDSQKVKDDISEDHREEGESIIDLRQKIEELESKFINLESNLNQIHKNWTNGKSNDFEDKVRDYDSVKGDLK